MKRIVIWGSLPRLASRIAGEKTFLRKEGLTSLRDCLAILLVGFVPSRDVLVSLDYIRS